jgi:membrane protein YqaA with SNARE-associated domain
MSHLLAFVLVNPVWTWLHRLGGPGLILLGLADNSIIPMPGSMDILVILLSANNPQWWPYYAVMGTLGAVVGGYVTYCLAEEGGKETLEKKVSKQRAQKVYTRFAKHGFFTVFLGAILPPPFPIVPFLMAAGVLHYPSKKFLGALTTGRGVRFFGFAFIAHIYGVAIIGWLSRYYKPVLYSLIVLAVAGTLAGIVYLKWYRPKTRSSLA